MIKRNKRILYIGQYTKGTTSKMRADVLFNLFKNYSCEIIDTDIPFKRSARFIRSIGFRYKVGPLISKVNHYVLKNIKSDYDLIWVDKAIFLTKSTVKYLKVKTDLLVHHTPDMTFFENRSNHFYKSITFFDYLITTKSQELDSYKSYVGGDKVILTTQGYSEDIHRNYTDFADRENAIVFVGLWESHRENIIVSLIEAEIKVYLAGKKWQKFAQKFKDNTNFFYLGEGLFSEDYVSILNRCKMGLGLLSKRFPELHTTRTFEIPACGTALLTEDNIETGNIFNKNEVIFYNSTNDLIESIKYYSSHSEELEEIAKRGYTRVRKNGYDYNSIIKSILKQTDMDLQT